MSASGLVGAGAASAARAGSPGAGGSLPVYGALSGVAVTSARNAWACGRQGWSEHTLILHWNGTAWKRVPCPAPAYGLLSQVAATSARNAWAVGQIKFLKTLILHWNGRAWHRVRSPTPAGAISIRLTGVAATSARNAW